MNHSSEPVPEPVVPEHQLLADAAPEIELSSSFRSKVLSDCAAQTALAQKIYVAKVAAGVAVVVAVIFLWFAFPQKPKPVLKPQVQPPSHNQYDVPPHYLNGADASPAVSAEGPIRNSAEKIASEEVSPVGSVESAR